MANTLESIINLPKLNSESILRELPLTDFQVSPMTSLELVEYQFNEQPDLPGVIIASDEKFFGMISRRYFHEQMNYRYGRELFIKRPIQYFLKATPTKYLDNCLVLLSEEKINLAVQIALNRSEETVYEPLVIQFVNKKNPNFSIYFLLNFKTLILAQSHLLREVNNELSRYKSSAKNYLMQLKHKQQKLQQHTTALQTQKQEILARHKLLEIQQNGLISQSQQIHNLNHRLKEITGFISQEGKKAFYATFEGVQKINKNMDKIVNIGHLFTNELKLINSASHQIETVSKQAKHLAIQAAIVAGHSNSQLSGFSHITNEIGKLVNETSQAGRQMNLVANNLMMKISELNNLAETGKQTAQSLVENNQRSEITLDELEKLIQQPNLDRAAVNSSGVTQGSKITDISQENPYQDKNIVNNYQEKFEEKNTDISELQMQILNNKKDKEKLIQQIRSTLNKKKFDI
ncbi:MAG: hypothetical protein F6K23_19345 [Okeania sp. SIO2C9]|uniref:hypothetical protein n=1 Tax=Okeania sp. SIO2C9 TaxID=2607791 RepID=UPI0013C14828|nr:hypothetical protein [Okeania sp. SIO2C9]NEQ75001.1 hypothetical protein [Okeania sp. SIO2C9]